MNTTIAHAAFSSLQTALAGRYIFDRELSRGGMATVFLARDLDQDRDVAVKVLIPELAMALGTERFLREISVATALRHPRIVGVLGSGRVPASAAGSDGVLFYVMPFVDGGSLRDRLDRVKQLPIDEAIAITRQVAEALTYAHANNVIHRDIKPENILFDASGALVADFGVARAVAAVGGDTLTRTGIAVGTPTYMSPEQAMGAKDVTPASDIYSLACVLYEMLAGQPPFTGPTAGVVFARHVLDTPPNLRIMRSGVTDALEDAILRAMAKSPADRHRSVAEFASALTDRAAAARQRAPNVAPGPPQRLVRPVWWRRRIPRAAAAVALPVMTAGLVVGFRAVLLARPSDLPTTSVGVLTFEDGSPGKTLGAVANGLTDALIGQLDDVPQLDVASRNGSLYFKGPRGVAVDSIARALKAGTLVSGRVTSVDNNIRVDLELRDGTTGWRVGTARIEAPHANPIALQDSLARAATRLFRRRTNLPMLTLVSQPGTRNPQAWDAMQRAQRVLLALDSLLRARYTALAGMSREGSAAVGNRKGTEADSLLAVAQEMDEFWAAPHIERARLAFTLSRLSAFGNERSLRQVDSGLAHAAAALELAPNDMRALEIRGTLHYWQWLMRAWDPAVAESSFLASVERDLTAAASRERSRASAWNVLSHLLIAKGQTQRASAAADRAFELDPFLIGIDRTIWRLMTAALDMGYADQASKWCREGRRRYPQDYRFTECEIWLNALPGSNPDMTQVWAWYDKYLALSPQAIHGYNRLKGRVAVALATARAGRPDSARALAESAIRDSVSDPSGELLYLAAFVHAQLGDTVKALDLLTRWVQRSPMLRSTALATDKSWWLKGLRSHPRYQALSRQRRR